MRRRRQVSGRSLHQAPSGAGYRASRGALVFRLRIAPRHYQDSVTTKIRSSSDRSYLRCTANSSRWADEHNTIVQTENSTHALRSERTRFANAARFHVKPCPARGSETHVQDEDHESSADCALRRCVGMIRSLACVSTSISSTILHTQNYPLAKTSGHATPPARGLGPVSRETAPLGEDPKFTSRTKKPRIKHRTVPANESLAR